MAQDPSLQAKLRAGYPEGFSTPVESERFEPGLDEGVVRRLSALRNEPDWLLQLRLDAFAHWQTLSPPTWGNLRLPEVDFQAISYHSSPKAKYTSIDEVDPAILADFERLGVPLHERARLAGVAVEAVFDSQALGTTFQKKLAEAGVIFCSISQAVREHPELVRKYLCSVVPYRDNFYACLNTAVFSDGSFVYLPPGVKCPMELSTYFRINDLMTGQFERTLIIADKGAQVSYLEGCFLEGAPVFTRRGTRPIEKVKMGDWVWTHTGKLRKVSAVMSRPYAGQIVSIKPVGFDIPFHATAEHPFLVVPRRQVVSISHGKKKNWLPPVSNKKLLAAAPIWVPAAQLEEGDFMVFPKVKIQKFSNLNKYEAELLGYYLAEGSSYFNKANKQFTIQVSLGLHEEKLAKRVQYLIDKVFSRPTYITRQPDRNGLSVSFFSKKAHDWFKKQVGLGALKKRLSREILDMSPDLIPLFIDAYMEGDGNVCTRTHTRVSGEKTVKKLFRLCTSSRFLVWDLQFLLRRMGIFGIAIKRDAGFDNGPNGRRIYRQDSWQIAWSETPKFCHVREMKDAFLVPIRKLDFSDTDTTVFNLSVEKDESYLIAGAAAHNCSAPMRDDRQLHAAVVELIALDDAIINYATVQNWYPGDAEGRGGILNYVTKRGQCQGARSQIHWTQVETGSAITWKYPSCVLLGDDSVGSFRSVALSKQFQQADTGTKMIHVGARTKSTIVSKGISTGHGQNTYRGLVRMEASAQKARNHTRCDSLLIGKDCGAHTFPVLEIKNPSAIAEHEATTGRVSEEQLYYCRTRGLSEEQAVNLIVEGFCRPVLDKLPMEFAVEARRLLETNLEGAVG